MPKGRVMEVQSHTHDLYGAPIFTPDMVSQFIKTHAIENGGSLLRWCWVLQDKDTYTQEEEDASAASNDGTPMVFAGDKKPAHIHLALEWRNPVSFFSVAKAFGLPERQVQKPKARYNQFLHMCRYQTHESPDQQAKGKHRYDDSEIHCNFDFRREIDKFTASDNRSKALRMSKASFAELIEKVEAGEITPEEIRKEYGYAFYQDKQKQIDLARHEYIKRYYVPSLRINFYVDAKGETHGGRIGKTQLCKMLARSLCPGLLDSECYYEVGSSRSGLQHYNEQPVIIWNDMRAGDMIQEFGRTEVLNMLDDHPGKVESRILYGTVVPVQKFNIINGIEDYDTFLKGLAGTYKDKFGNLIKAEDESQVYGRFPFIIHVSQEWIDFLISQGWMNGTREYMRYEKFARCINSIRGLMKRYDGDALNALSSDTSKDVVEKVRYLESKNSEKISDVTQIHDEDKPISLNAEEIDLMEKKLYDIYYDNITSSYNAYDDDPGCLRLRFYDWLKEGGNYSGIVNMRMEKSRTYGDHVVILDPGTHDKYPCLGRAFTTDEIRNVAMQIKLSSNQTKNDTKGE